MEKVINIKAELIAVYEDWLNSFITVPAFADYYGLSEKEANKVIALGKELREKRFKESVEFLKK